MFDFIDGSIYNIIYYYFLLMIVILVFLYFIKNSWSEQNRHDFTNLLGMPVLIILILYVGFRPIYGNSGDMPSYLRFFNEFSNQSSFDLNSSEPIFNGFMWMCSKIMIPEYYFFILTTIYFLGPYFACKKWFNNDWFLPFFMIITSFQFYNYGINGIRNGVAASVFIFAMSRDNIFLKLLLFYFTIGIHKSMFLVAFGYSLTYINSNPRYFILFWLSTIPLSLAFSDFFEEQLQIYLPDDKVGEYFQKGWYDDQFSQIGFRWDFVIYSASAILVGWYYIFKNNFKDKIYNQLYCCYLLVNGVWILLINANYSNRFAYLSWFFLGAVVTYPLFKKQFLVNQNVFYAFLLLGYYIITISLADGTNIFIYI